ncbi:hypothetical protein JCGZ_22848 [Jatropha curcas]|uniref:Peptidase A1 domain-containing protein n=1 Tax=Jatropha curcas TaxID=180498 RepID=A0A067JT00_JATCU|nr:probable aspartic proteinase GIP2 [Jatropha curcas]KDP25943.1 hypothetical protein JCGZ_22848 [Jatropha curcas]
MASSFLSFLLLCSLLFFISPSLAKTPFRPKGLLLRVTKDSSTSQYLTHIKQRTPFVPLKVTVDLGGKFLWVDCEDYISSSYKPVSCDSKLCTLANSHSCTSECYSAPKPGCHNNTCDQLFYNPVSRVSSSGQIGQDILSLESTDGRNPGKLVSVPNLAFTCGYTSSLESLANGVKGIAGFGINNISLPFQLSSAFRLQKKFAMCLSSSPQAEGVIFFGDGPYVMLPGIDSSKILSYTPLLINPVSTSGAYFAGDASVEYFIRVKSIEINEKQVKINKKLLSITEEGKGGTKISTVNPYTVLETSIYKAVTKAFVKALSKVPRVKAVAPFGVCFSAKHIGVTRVGPAVPTIDLVLQNNGTVWRIWGTNSMVNINDNALCLAFVDGGADAETSIVIGGHQLEENLLQFDFGSKTLGFSGPLPFWRTTCANFNFTSV